LNYVEFYKACHAITGYGFKANRIQCSLLHIHVSRFSPFLLSLWHSTTAFVISAMQFTHPAAVKNTILHHASLGGASLSGSLEYLELGWLS
jgi:hypothetical protein